MSHFIMMVIGEDVESILAPYYEGAESEEEAASWQYEDMTSDVLDHWENGKEEVMIFDGAVYTEYSLKYGEHRNTNISWNPDLVTEVTVAQYAEMKGQRREEYLEDYFGYKVDYCEFTGEEQWGYWYNAMGKWDWWVIGGRWSGYFLAKPGKGEIGESGVFGNKPEEGYVDQIRKGDIDIVGMYAKARAKAEKTYDVVEEALAVAGIPPRWSDIRDMWPIDAARKIYRDNKAVKAFSEKKLSHFMGEIVDDYYLDSGGREQYVRDAECRCLLPFGFVSEEHGWVEKGDMGWFGIVIDDKGKYDWYAEFMKMWEELPDDTLITAVDCHV